MFPQITGEDRPVVERDNQQVERDSQPAERDNQPVERDNPLVVADTVALVEPPRREVGSRTLHHLAAGKDSMYTYSFKLLIKCYPRPV